jgi:hypothetical protein
MAEGKPEGGTPAVGGRSTVRGNVSRAGRELAQEVRRAGGTAARQVAKAGKTAATQAAKAGRTAATQAVKAGRTARDFGAGVQKQVKRVQKDLAPAAAKARKGLQQAQQGLGKAFQATARATRKSARILGLKAQIAAAMRKRQKLYGQIGETYFKLQKRKGATPILDKALAELVKGTEAANREIRQLEAREKIERGSP